MKYLLSLLLVFESLATFSQQPKKLHIDISRTAKKPFNTFYLTSDRYYIIFNSHGVLHSSNPEINSFAGHTWVMWGHENPQTKQSEINGYGFWPNYGVLRSATSDNMANLLVGSTAVIGSVPGTLREDLFGTPYSKTLKQIVFTVDKATYDNSRSVIEKYKQTNPNYSLLRNDCVNFFIEVGKSIGIDMPARNILSPSSWRPSDYMDLFIDKVTSPDKMSIDNNNGYVNASPSGEYNTVFGSQKNGNSNVCKVDNIGNWVEQKYRNGKLTSQQINYPNGDTWYTEPLEDNGIPVTNPDGSTFKLPSIPTSEYRFANGNTILSYNPSTFNPNFTPVNLSTGKDAYLGAINSAGIPNGNGTLTHMDFDQNGWINNTAKTGIFINGNFSNYTGVDIGIGTAYGQFSNGQLSGEARIEYNDGRIFTGTFVNGMANGYGTGTNRHNDHFLSGPFKNGKADGFCTSKNESGLYKGDFKNGQCTGNGTWWVPNGNVFQGSFQDGKAISGKTTMPNGNYYVGNYDTNGNPSGGKYYNKNGGEISEREGRGGGVEHTRRDGNTKVGYEVDGGKDYEINGVSQGGK